MPPSPIERLAELSELPDPRGVRHPLVPVLALGLVATLAGCTSLAAISQFGRDRGAAFAHALGFRRGKTPAPSTLSELLRDLDADALDWLLGRWLAARHADGWDHVALDGKTVRGSRDGEAAGVHLLATYAPQAAAVIGQLRVDAKTNEHKAALRLLGVLPPLNRAVVTGDAMFTHHDVDDAVLDASSEYLLFVKNNQEIPTQRNRAEQREVDPHPYRERNVGERFWAQAKQFRRVATRHEKKAANFLAFAWVAALMVVLK